MGYDAARNCLNRYRSVREGSFIGESRFSWFLKAFSSVKNMLETFNSDAENKAVASSYMAGKANTRIPAHMKLDYVLGARREVRKQYVSGEDGIYTDVTPFRHGAFSIHGAGIFDTVMNDVLSKGARTA